MSEVIDLLNNRVEGEIGLGFFIRRVLCAQEVTAGRGIACPG